MSVRNNSVKVQQFCLSLEYLGQTFILSAKMAVLTGTGTKALSLVIFYDGLQALKDFLCMCAKVHELRSTLHLYVP